MARVGPSSSARRIRFNRGVWCRLWLPGIKSACSADVLRCHSTCNVTHLLTGVIATGAGCAFEVTWRRSHRAGDVELGKLCRKKLVNELNDASATRACGNQGNAFLDRWQGIRDRYNQPANVTEGKVVFGIADPDAI
jgi:hypothetical protein